MIAGVEVTHFQTGVTVQLSPKKRSFLFKNMPAQTVGIAHLYLNKEVYL
jgi:hypothetical protein